MWSIDKAKKWVVAGSIFTVAAVVLRDVFLGSGFVITGDSAFQLNPQVFFSRSFYVWYPYHHLGGLNTHAASFPIYFIWSLPTFIRLSAEVSNKLWYFFLLVTPAFSMYYFSGIAVKDKYARLASALFYMINPILLERLIGGSVFFLAACAVLPLVFAFYFKALEKNIAKNSIMMGLVLAFAASCSIHILYMIGIVLLLHIVYSLVLHRNIGKIAEIGKTLVVSGTTFFTVDFYWISLFMMPGNGSQPRAWPIQQLFLNTTHVSLLNVVRLLGGLNLVSKGFTYGHLSVKGILLFIMVLTVGLFLLLMVASTWIFRPKDKFVRFFTVVLFVSVFLSKGPNPPFGDLFTQIYLNVPGFGYLFRDPSKFLIFVALSYALFLGVAMEEIYERLGPVRAVIDGILGKTGLRTGIKRNQLYKAMPTLMVATLIFAYSYPMFFGFYGHLNPLAVPTEYLRTNDWLSSQDGEFRVYWVPIARNFILSHNYEWNPHGTAIFVPEYIDSRDKPIVNWGRQSSHNSNDMAFYTYSTMHSNWTSYLGKVLGLLNAKYIVVDRGMSAYVDYPRFPPSQFINTLAHQDGIRLVHEDGSLLVFENSWFKPSILAVSNAELIIGGRSALISLANLDGFYPPALFFGEQLQSTHDEVLSGSNSKIFIVDKDYTDFVFSLIDRSHFLSPYRFAPPGAPKYSWRTSGSPDGSWASYRGEILYGEAYAFSKEESHLKVPFSVHNEDTYDVWIRMAFGPRQGKLTLTLDGQVLTRGLDCRDDRYLGFRWVKIDSLSLKEGEHTIVLYNGGGGEMAIDQIAVVPQDDFADYESKAAAHNERLGLYYIFEAEKSFSADQNMWYTSDQWGGNASNGYVLSCENSTGAAYTDFYVPMNTSLRAALRVVMGPTAGNLSVKIDDDISFFLPLNSSTQHLSWVETASFELNKGTHRLTVESDGSSRVDFDEAMVFSIQSGEEELPLENLLSSDLNSASCTFVKIEPTRYRIHVRADAPFFLVFSESWHPSWQVDVDGETLSPILVNTFANGYFIKKTGEFDITLEFKLQVYYTISGYVSLFSLLGVLVYIAHEEIRRTIFVTKRKVEKLGKHLRKLIESMRARLLLERKGEMR